MSVRVIVCEGCCCGNVEKGHDEVPTEFLEDAWAEKCLDKNAQLTISSCLGPCEMRNVVILKTEDRLTWLGGLSGEDDYKSLVNWVYDFSKNNLESKLPEGLQKLEFERDQDFEFPNS